MALFRKLISLEDALKKALSFASKNEVEEISFKVALNRVLAEDVCSPIDSPPFDRAAMDGYAIRGEDSFGASPDNPLFLKKVKKTKEVEVGEGECLVIQTGMAMPKGSNAVVMLEYTKDRGEEVEIFRAVTPGKNVSFRGEDAKKGEIVLKEGRLLNPYDIGMLVSVAQNKVKVYERSKLGIISTGDELLDPNEHAHAHAHTHTHTHTHEQEQRKIMDTNSYILEALVQKIAIPHRIGIVGDDYNELKNTVISSLEEYDGLLISGGSSVGEKDFLVRIMEYLGKIIFHGVAIRPGGPTGFALIENKPVFILPGYPVATISAFELLVRPFLYAMHGVKEEKRKQIFAIARRKIPSEVGRCDFVRVRLLRNENEYYADPVGISGSGILSSMTKSDGFVVIKENKEGIEENERILVNVYD